MLVRQNVDASKSTLTTESETDSGPPVKHTKPGHDPEEDLEMVKVCG